jgi:predicted nucleic acid-binding protein
LNLLFDAGSLMNLDNGQVLELLVSTPEYLGHAGQMVLGECKQLQAKLARLEAIGRLQTLPDLPLSAAEFAARLRQHNLGLGETECLILAELEGFTVSCDDRRARNVLREVLGAERVTGTIGLLIRGVWGGLLGNGAAFASYQAMRARGGFLPAYTQEEFADLLV